MADYENMDDSERRNRVPPKKSKVPAGKPSASQPQPSKAKAGPGGAGGPRRSEGTRGGGEQTLVLKQVDLSELSTEEALQNEKLAAAREIEEGVRDIKECYDEFSQLVNHQQVGLDKASKNIETSVVNVQKGTTELKSASEHQKASRKKMCILVAILVVVIVVVIVVVLIMKKA